MSSRLRDGEEEPDGPDTIPDPPPTPTVEYLLGKRPVNLRRRANQTFKDQIQERAAHLAARERNTGQDSDDSSVGSSVSSKGKHRHKKGSKHRKKRTGHKGEGDIEWNYNQLGVLQSSPSRSRKGLERIPTPMPSQVPLSGMSNKKTLTPVAQKLNFDTFDEMHQLIEQALSSTSPSSSLSPLNSPSSQSSPSSSLETSPLHKNQRAPPVPPSSPTSPHAGTAAGAGGRSKRGGPKLPPHMQNKQIAKQNIVDTRPAAASSQPTGSQPTARTAPTSRLTNKRPAPPPPTSSGKLKFFRQRGRTDNTPTVNDGEGDTTMDDIELQLDEMKSRLVDASAKSMLHPSTVRRPPSPELQHASTDEESESESESSEYTSSSDHTTTSESEDSSSEDSSDEEMQMKKPLVSKRPVVGKNAGHSQGKGGFNRLRMLSRYPRLFRKKIINLDTIKEIAEEVLYNTVSCFVVLLAKQAVHS